MLFINKKQVIYKQSSIKLTDLKKRYLNNFKFFLYIDIINVCYKKHLKIIVKIFDNKAKKIFFFNICIIRNDSSSILKKIYLAFSPVKNFLFK